MAGLSHFGSYGARMKYIKGTEISVEDHHKQVTKPAYKDLQTLSKRRYNSFSIMYSSVLLTLFVAAATASPVAIGRARSLEAREADAYAGFEALNPLSKREINPNTVNVLTPAQLTAQRNALFLAQTETAREAILFSNAPNAANDTFQFVNKTVTAPTGGTILLSTINSKSKNTAPL
jgi:hypothetical protein